MDIFGIGTAMKSMIMTYAQASRRTGRTTVLIESLKNGDRVVFSDRAEADRVSRMCRDRGLKINCVVIEPREPQKLIGVGPPSKGRTIFDHTWVERFYLRKVKEAGEEIDYWQRETSGYGEAHIETKRQAQERAKWHL